MRDCCLPVSKGAKVRRVGPSESCHLAETSRPDRLLLSRLRAQQHAATCADHGEKPVEPDVVAKKTARIEYPIMLTSSLRNSAAGAA